MKASGYRGIVAVFGLGAGLYFLKADLNAIKADARQTRDDAHECREQLNTVLPTLNTMQNGINTLKVLASGKCPTTASNNFLEQAGIIRKGSR